MKRLAQRGFTLIEIMIVVAIIALLAAIAIPNVLRGRTSANEAAAIGNIRALVSGLEMARSVSNKYPDGPGNWVADMYTNATPPYGPQPFNHVMDGTACPAAAASSCSQGYRYTYAPGGSVGQTYTIVAAPDATSQTGTRMFFVNETAVIRHCNCTANAAAPCVAFATAATSAVDATPWSTIDSAPDGNTATVAIDVCS